MSPYIFLTVNVLKDVGRGGGGGKENRRELGWSFFLFFLSFPGQPFLVIVHY